MEPRYAYIIKGTAANEQTWEVSGDLDNCRSSMSIVVAHIIKVAYEHVVDGTAVYGQPGVGCHGPYKITMLLVERVGE